MINIFAHRGYSSKYFENSKESFKACVDLNIKGIELDVQFTKDGELVVIHDEYLDRLLGVNKFVKDINLRDLKNLKYANGESPITLREYIEIIKYTDLMTNVELKTGIFEYIGIEREVFNLFKEYKMIDRLLVSSFNHYSLLRFKKICQSKVAALTESNLIHPEKYLKENGFEIYHPFFTTIDDEIINNLKSENIITNTWTVNDKKSFDNLKSIGVDGIITNYPELDFKY